MVTAIIAALLLAASWEIPFPEHDRYWRARHDLAVCMRGLA